MPVPAVWQQCRKLLLRLRGISRDYRSQCDWLLAGKKLAMAGRLPQYRPALVKSTCWRTVQARHMEARRAKVDLALVRVQLVVASRRHRCPFLVFQVWRIIMTRKTRRVLSRRSFVAGTTGVLASATAGGLLPSVIGLGRPAGATPMREFKLHAKPGSAQLAPIPHPLTKIWGFNGVVPGPELRLRQAERLRFSVLNGLKEETTVHCHGLRLPNAMDGIPHLTQKPIAPGETFTYEFDVPDAGTYWYHPHQRSSEQVGRGLYGPLIIEERHPITVDRDVTWMLDDWRLTRNAQISAPFGNRHDMVHGGRIGNTVTINGRIEEIFKVRRGERIRLRLINAANARMMALKFAGHKPTIIAYDGQPVAPHEPSDGRIVLGPAMRIDLIVDMMQNPGARFTVTDEFYNDGSFRLLDLVYDKQALRDKPLDASVELAANTMPEPDMNDIVRHEIRFNGGMMGGMFMKGESGRNMMKMMRAGNIWFINGRAASKHVSDPLLTLQKGRSYLFDMQNDTVFDHPIHLHGHSFRVLSRNGVATKQREWQDTVLMAPRERVEIAFVADNPGDWMFHCHIFEHQEAGMMGVIRVGDEPGVAEPTRI